MAPPKVSIVIPTYKRKAELSRAIDSIFEQTFHGWELIVVNDDPETDVGDILPKDNRITYLNHSENLGAPIARNDGIKRSSGEYVALLDDDDAWKPTKLKRQIRELESRDKEYGLIYAGRDIIRDGQVVEEYHPDLEGDIYDTLLRRNVIPSETPLIRRDCFDRVGLFDPDLESGQDRDMWLRIAKEYKVAALSDSLAIAYQDSDNRISDDMERKYSGQKRLLEKYWEDLRDNPDAFAKRCRQMGIYATRTSRRKEAIYYYSISLWHELHFPTVLYATTNLLPATLREEFFALLESVVDHGFPSGILHWLQASRSS